MNTMFTRVLVAVSLFVALTSTTVPASAYSNNRTIVSPNALSDVVMHIHWQGLPDNDVKCQLEVKLILVPQPGGKGTTYQLKSNMGGEISVTGLEPGTYVYWVKGPKYLALSGELQLVEKDNYKDVGVMLTGDSDNNNTVGLPDFNILHASFGRKMGDYGYDDRADFTGDGVVDLQDWTLLKSNFGWLGAPPPES